MDLEGWETCDLCGEDYAEPEQDDNGVHGYRCRRCKGWFPAEPRTSPSDARKRCRKCDSTDIIALMVYYISGDRRWQCQECNHTWLSSEEKAPKEPKCPPIS